MYDTSVIENIKANQVSSRMHFVRAGINLVGFFVGVIMKRILLTQGKFAIVDDEDYEKLSQYRWYLLNIKKYNLRYAYRSVMKKGKVSVFLMHREILGLKKGDGIKTDHRNHNGLDNRRINIRPCTHSQNIWNQRKKAKGYCWCKARKKWVSRIRHNGKRIDLGGYKKEKDAGIAYQEALTKLRGSYLDR